MHDLVTEEIKKKNKALMREILYGWLNIKRNLFFECSSFCYGVSWLSVSKIVLCLYFAPEVRVLINRQSAFLCSGVFKYI